MSESTLSRTSLLLKNTGRIEQEKISSQSKSGPSSWHFMPFLMTGNNTARSSQLQISVNSFGVIDEFSLREEIDENIICLPKKPLPLQILSNIIKKSISPNSKRLFPVSPITTKLSTPSKSASKNIRKTFESKKTEEDLSHMKSTDRETAFQTFSQQHSSLKVTADSNSIDTASTKQVMKKASSSMSKLSSNKNESTKDSIKGSLGTSSNPKKISPFEIGPSSGLSKVAEAQSKLKEMANQICKPIQLKDTPSIIQNKKKNSNISFGISSNAQEQASKNEKCFTNFLSEQLKQSEPSSKEKSQKNLLTSPSSPQFDLWKVRSKKKCQSNDRNYSKQQNKSGLVWERLTQGKSSVIIQSPIPKSSRFASLSHNPKTSSHLNYSNQLLLSKMSFSKHTEESIIDQISNKTGRSSSKFRYQTFYTIPTEPIIESSGTERPDPTIELKPKDYVFLKEGKAFHVHPILAESRVC